MNAGPAATILAIDDEPVVRESMASYLQDSGYTVLQCGDGREGLELVRRTAPDVVLLDLRMPRMDGLEFLEAIGRAAPETPVIVVSGTGVLQDAIEALRRGALDFVTKPILDMAVLEHAVRSALERARLRRENARYREHLEQEIARRTADLVDRTAALEASNRSLTQEIAQRRRAEEALRRREQKFRELADLLPQPVFEVDARGHFSFINRYGREAFGATPEAIEGGLWAESIIVSEHREDARRRLQEILAGEGAGSLETLVRRGDGTAFPAMIYASPVVRSGAPEGLRGILFDLTEIRKAQDALRASEASLREENLRLKSSLGDIGRFGDIVGKSAAMRHVYEVILKAAASEASVIITGESGTGKELVAQTIHRLSARKGGPFVTVNCGAIPENLLESEFFGYRKGAFTGAHADKPGFLARAEGGSLFLDEIGEIHASLQVKLLRAIDGGGYAPIGGTDTLQPDIRIIAATNRDLAREVEQGRLREDFYYRIHVIPIHLPPLRDRAEDIPLLIQHFLQEFSGEGSPPVIPAPVVRTMFRRTWPGNVRELRNAVHRYLTLESVDSGPPAPARAPLPGADQPAPLGAFLADAERHYLLELLNRHQWHRSRVAEVLQIDRRTLFRKMKSHGL